MFYLVDTGVLLRVFNRADSENLMVHQCLRALKREGHTLAVSTHHRVITLNQTDFARYPDIIAQAPKTVVEALSKPQVGG